MATTIDIKVFDKDWELSSNTNLSELTATNNNCGIFKDGDYFYVVSYLDQAVYKYDSDLAYTDTSYDISGTSEYPIRIFKYAGKWYILDVLNYGGTYTNTVYEFNTSFVATGNSWSLSSDFLVLDFYHNGSYWYITTVDAGGCSVYIYKDDFTAQGTSYDISSETSFYCVGVFKQGDYWYATYTFNDEHKIFQYNMSWEYTETYYDITDDVDTDTFLGVINVES